MEAVWKAEAAEDEAKEAAHRHEQQALQERVAALEALVQQLSTRQAPATSPQPARAMPSSAGPDAANSTAAAASSSTATAAGSVGATCPAPDQAAPSAGAAGGGDGAAAESHNTIGWWGRLLLPIFSRQHDSKPDEASSEGAKSSTAGHAGLTADARRNLKTPTDRRQAEGVCMGHVMMRCGDTGEVKHLLFVLSAAKELEAQLHKGWKAKRKAAAEAGSAPPKGGTE